MCPSDADGLMTLMNAEERGSSPSDFSHSISNSVREIFLNRTKDDYRFVAVYENKIIGQVCLRSSQQGPMLTINVRKDYRRGGVASALLEHMIAAAKQISAWDRIDTDVFDDNQPAIRLYQKFEFKIMSHRIIGDGCKILRMSKSIR